MTTLSELLADESIALDTRAKDWRDALRQAGDLLGAAGVAEPAYTDAMIAGLEEHGPYIVISPGFAFAHARPSAAVHRTGIAWLSLAEPVEFGHAKNDPVSLVVALAATDDKAHTTAMAQLAKLLGNSRRRAALDAARTPAELREALDAAAGAASSSTQEHNTRNKILTVCGNGLGTSLFLKNTLEDVLDRWGWAPFITVEATDTISAKGKAKEADLVLTSGEIARTLGDVGIPVHVIEDFTSTTEIDAALRELYDI